MSTNEYVTEVTLAQAGDLRAFQRLVARFQDQVTAFAFSWVGELEIARDVAQEVFLEAHLCLDQLSEPAAFPGWLRRIVVKRCDRVTRRKQLPTTGSVEEIAQARTDDISDPVQLAQSDELAHQLRLSIAALPEPQRMVIALQYFAEISGEEIAAFLELPLTTVKKRLHDARRKLRDHGEQLMQKSIEHMKPSATPQFSAETAFFIALRERNVYELERLLAESPELANAEQNWSHELAHQRVLPFPNRATALIAAIELDDPQIMDLLLKAGADPDGRCGCVTGEPAIWAAALFNRSNLAARLLAAGADPNVISASGNTALHVAAMRGHREVINVLMEHGADPQVLDTGVDGSPPLVTTTAIEGPRRTAADWARISGHDDIAVRLEGGESASLKTRSCVASVSDGLLATGIRALDFFAPIEPRALVRFPFAAGVGMVVLLGELSHRFVAADDGAVVWTGFTQPPFDQQDWQAEMAEFGLDSKVHGELASFRAAPEERRATFESGLKKIESLRAAGKQVLAVVLSTQGYEQDVEASFPRLMADEGTGTVTSVVVTPFQATDGPWSQLKRPFTAQWTLDRARSVRRLYPAIDPALAFSSTEIEARHRRLRDAVVQVLVQYQESDPQLEGFDPGRAGLALGDELAHRLLRYFSQSFGIATPFGGMPGEYTPLAKTLDAVEALLSSG